MPTLLLFAACERVIIGQEDNSLSLVSVMTGVSAQLPFAMDQPIPENTAIPLRWYLVALWKNEPDEIGIPFDQRVTLETSGGTELVHGEQKLETQLPLLRSINAMTIFPVGTIGTLTAKIFLRGKSSGSEWLQYGTFPIDVQRGQAIDLLPPKIETSSVTDSAGELPAQSF